VREKEEAMHIHNAVSMSTTSTLHATPDAAPKPEGGESFATVMKRSKESVVEGATNAQVTLPGQPTASLALRGPMVTSPATMPPVMSPAGSTLAEGPSNGAASGGTSTTSIQSAMQQSQDQSMQMLAIQQAMSAQSLQFQTASNVQRAQADTAKSVCQNIHS
jgi:hypothetical protein